MNNQGPNPICTRHALARSIQMFYKKRTIRCDIEDSSCCLNALRGRRDIRFNFEHIKVALDQVYLDTSGRDPSEYDGKVISVEDENCRRLRKIKLDIQNVPDLSNFPSTAELVLGSRIYIKKNSNLTCVWDPTVTEKEGPGHALYVKESRI